MTNYHKIVNALNELIKDEVKLVHGGNIVDWKETKRPELLEEASNPNNGEIPAGTQLKHKFSGQDHWVPFDDEKTISLSTMHNEIYYPKEIAWEHFEMVEKDDG